MGGKWQHRQLGKWMKKKNVVRTHRGMDANQNAKKTKVGVVAARSLGTPARLNKWSQHFPPASSQPTETHCSHQQEVASAFLQCLSPTVLEGSLSCEESPGPTHHPLLLQGQSFSSMPHHCAVLHKEEWMLMSSPHPSKTMRWSNSLFLRLASNSGLWWRL